MPPSLRWQSAVQAYSMVSPSSSAACARTSIVLPIVLGITVVQRALVADSTTEWVITALHGAAVVVIGAFIGLALIQRLVIGNHYTFGILNPRFD